jgi:glucosamine-6-phosphate deaminase
MSEPVKTFIVDALQVRVYANINDLAKDAAKEARMQIQQAVSSAGKCAVILATGNSQIKFLEILTTTPSIDWSKVTFFHMDEYLGIDKEHHASFRKFLSEKVAKKVNPYLFNYIEGDALEPIDECTRYTNLLKAQPINLCCLGIGENGHLAFNDPPVAKFDDPHWVKIVKLDLKCRQQQVGEGHFPHLPAVPQYAITLTIPALCSAQKMICVAPERRKAQAVKDTLTGPIDPSCPASILRKCPHAILFLDTESAALL